MKGNRPVIEPIALGFVNAYIIHGERDVLVDTGLPGMADKLLDELKKRNVSMQDISLILLTHGHSDHAGNANELRRRLHVPVAIHALEVEWMRRGLAPIPRPIRPIGHLIKAITKPNIEPFEPDILLEAGMALSPYGIAGQVIHTPGHSPGSITFLHPEGIGIAGDVLAGSLWRENHPLYPFFADDVPLLHQSIAKLLRASVQRVYFGHGRPSSLQEVQRRFAARVASVNDLAFSGQHS
ncbi:MBL fold metallo-hydrolase [Dictyobacter alpinus]|uniref:MBL fold metallo-hydrolase n=1 Tax=Dictyobacter alpinus TaxID=2014873 RepID=A0A402BJL0_9CHLR|nr:MBL fold metallo-hydrolase [Dictyobacter alpinus]GCE31538.1 MBL fold metallo-hydrolase [Dictyobacter alpinus]